MRPRHVADSTPGQQQRQPIRAGAILREIAPRLDRVPTDEAVDLPEIQESFRVSFSDEALAQAIANPPDRSSPRTDGLGPTGVDAYRRIAGY